MESKTDLKQHKRIPELSEQGKEFAVATIINALKGSPRKSGTKMIVFLDGSTEFTIGGGPLEAITIRKAISAIKKGQNIKFEIEFDLQKSGMACGGKAEVFIEVFKTIEKIVVFGGGHIGYALSRIFNVINMPYIIVDDRVDFATVKRFPEALSRVHSGYQEAVSRIDVDKNTYTVIVTHCHKGDKEVLRDLLKTKAKYIGMIGSVKKVKTVLDELKKEGLKTDDKRIYAPVGLELGGETPEEIALAVVSEINKVKYEKTGNSLREKMKL